MTDNSIGPALHRLRHSMVCWNETTLRTSFSVLVSFAHECQCQQRTGEDWDPDDPQVFVCHLFERIGDDDADLQREFVVHVIREHRCSI
jgi:hypothetical protein